jgi:hypothetical protein
MAKSQKPKRGRPNNNRTRKARKRHEERHLVIQKDMERQQRVARNNRVYQMVDHVLEQLKFFEPYIYKKATTTNSVYIKFRNKGLLSLRVSDHEGIPKYSYKWNLRSDIKEKYSKQDGRVNRIYFPFNEVNQLIRGIINYYYRMNLEKQNE